MDLRRRLVVRLALAFGALVILFMLVWLQDLREDAQTEQAAALRLVDLLVPHASRHQQGDTTAATGTYRHLRMRLESAGAEPSAAIQAAAPWLALPSAQAQERRIPVGDQVLVLSPDPDSELHEQLYASLQMIGMLIVFGGLCLLMTWRAVDQALRPAREIEAGLSRLQNGQSNADLPCFELREFQSIASRIDQLAAALAQAQAQQASLTGALMDVQDQERRHLAAELHDEFGQSLTAISATATYMQRHAGHADSAVMQECAREIGQETRRISSHVRQMLSQLKPYGLQDTDTTQALRELVSSWQARLPDLGLASHLSPLPRLTEDAALALYRSLQEALTNCVRHSQAKRVQVACSAQYDEVVLVVADDGVGRASALAQSPGHGLAGLRERLRRVGGQLRIEDNPTGGIVLSARVPFQERP